MIAPGDLEPHVLGCARYPSAGHMSHLLFPADGLMQAIPKLTNSKTAPTIANLKEWVGSALRACDAATMKNIKDAGLEVWHSKV